MVSRLVGKGSVVDCGARSAKGVGFRNGVCKFQGFGSKEMVFRVLSALVILLVAGSAFPEDSKFLEYRLKANFLVHAPSVVSWPESAFATVEEPFRLCVVGRFSFGTSLSELARGITSHNRHIEIRLVQKDAEFRGCHILFVSRSEEKRYLKVFERIRGSAVLTVGETPEFIGAGGALAVYVDQDLLRFEVNLAAAEEAHLKISSALLAMARRIVNRPDSAKN